MKRQTHLALYRATHVFYPSAFRAEYGEDLAALFEEQLGELGATRCWLRTVRDLIISVPAQHLEIRMKKPQPSFLFISSIAFAIGATLIAVVIGTSMVAALFALVAIACLAFAIASRRAAKPAIDLEQTSSWKKFLSGGGLMLATLIVILNVPANRDQELSTVAWSFMMFLLLLSFSLIGAGFVLGALHLSRRRHR